MSRFSVFVAVMFLFLSVTIASGANSIFIPKGTETMSNNDSVFSNIEGMQNVNIYFFAASGEEIRFIFYSHYQPSSARTSISYAETLRVEGNTLGTSETAQFQATNDIDSIYVYMEDPTDASITIWPDRKK